MKIDIVVDFDGTCVEHEYPKVGKSVPHATRVLRKLADFGHNLILFTMRSDKGINEGKFDSGLSDAVNWFKENEIPLYGIQRNPTQNQWTDSPKAYGQIYIDDAALGCPLIYEEGKRPFVDWLQVEYYLTQKGIL